MQHRCCCNLQAFRSLFKIWGCAIIRGDLHLETTLIPYTKVTSVVVVVITTAQVHSINPEPRFCAGSNHAPGVSEIQDGEDLWQWFRLEIRVNTFRRSTIPQKIFINSIQFITRQCQKWKLTRPSMFKTCFFARYKDYCCYFLIRDLANTNGKLYISTICRGVKQRKRYNSRGKGRAPVILKYFSFRISCLAWFVIYFLSLRIFPSLMLC